MDKSKLNQLKLGKTVLKRETLKDPIFWRDGFGTLEQVKSFVGDRHQFEHKIKISMRMN